MHKKGAEDERPLLYLWYLIAAVFILVFAIRYINNAVEKTGLDESYYSKDLAYTLDMVAASKDDLQFIYLIDENKFDFYIGSVDNENRVVVAQDLNELGKGAAPKSYQYNSKQNFGRFLKPEQLIITKKNGKIEINGIIAGLNIRAGEFLTNIISNDEHGDYRWKVMNIRDNKVIVKKIYVSAGIESDTAVSIKNKLKQYDEYIAASANKYNVDEDLIRAVIWKESNGRADARSSVGAIGLMQVLPETAGLTEQQLLDSEVNIDAGTKYLRELLDRFDDEELALASYNRGPTYIRSNCGDTFSSCLDLPDETLRYVLLTLGFKIELDISKGQTESGQTLEIKIGDIKVLDDDHTVKIVEVIGNSDARVEIT